MPADKQRNTIEELDRLREMEARTTDPLASRLLQDIIMELEAGLPPSGMPRRIESPQPFVSNARTTLSSSSS
jgi:hypothetical protein